jgi:SepF-like predicted cell division protein (DUF552 family)
MVFEKLVKKEELKKEKEEGKEEESESEWLELDSSAFKEKTDVDVRVDNLKDFADTDRVQRLVREGNIVFLKIKDLRQKDLTELKRAVDKLKKTCVAMEGDIVGVDENFLVLTPRFARIWRGR